MAKKDGWHGGDTVLGISWKSQYSSGVRLLVWGAGTWMGRNDSVSSDSSYSLLFSIQLVCHPNFAFFLNLLTVGIMLCTYYISSFVHASLVLLWKYFLYQKSWIYFTCFLWSKVYVMLCRIVTLMSKLQQFTVQTCYFSLLSGFPSLTLGSCWASDQIASLYHLPSAPAILTCSRVPRWVACQHLQGTGDSWRWMDILNNVENSVFKWILEGLGYKMSCQQKWGKPTLPGWENIILNWNSKIWII